VMKRDCDRVGGEYGMMIGNRMLGIDRCRDKVADEGKTKYFPAMSFVTNQGGGIGMTTMPLNP
jgi:hypothetical protein